MHPVETKLKIVLSVVSGETTQAEAARRHGVSETSIATWKDHVLQGGRAGLEQPAGGAKPTGREHQLEAEIDDLTRALGEAHVQIRALKRGGPQAMSFR